MENKKNYVESEKNLEYKKTSSDKIILAMVCILGSAVLLGQIIGNYTHNQEILIENILKLPTLLLIGADKGGFFEIVALIFFIMIGHKIYRGQKLDTILYSFFIVAFMYLYMNGILLNQDITFLRYNPIFQK